jgi:hypothetical protein
MSVHRIKGSFTNDSTNRGISVTDDNYLGYGISVTDCITDDNYLGSISNIVGIEFDEFEIVTDDIERFSNIRFIEIVTGYSAAMKFRCIKDIEDGVLSITGSNCYDDEVREENIGYKLDKCFEIYGLTPRREKVHLMLNPGDTIIYNIVFHC